MSNERIPTCCQAHGFEEGGCNGRNCPAGRIDLAAAVRYVSGYLSIFLRYCDHAAAKRAGHLAAVTKPEPKPQGWAWQTLVYLTICATAVGFVALWVTR